jgi:hypothetical protein
MIELDFGIKKDQQEVIEKLNKVDLTEHIEIKDFPQPEENNTTEDESS